MPNQDPWEFHKCLGMTIDYSADGKVRFSMIDYVLCMLDKLSDNMSAGENVRLVLNYLFEVNDQSEKLDGETADFFHHNTLKLLLLCKCSRPDVQSAVALFCTRIKNPNADDYKKLSRVISTRG